MMLLEFSMFPLDKGESVSEYVARSLEIIEASGVDYQLHSMGTVLEGKPAQLFAVVQECLEAMAIDCNRVEAVIKVDYRRGTSGRLQSKVAKVEQRVGHSLRT